MLLAILTSCKKGSNVLSDSMVDDIVSYPCESQTDLTNKTVTDCQCNTYPIVKIGDQWWMAENLKATLYDSKSEKAGTMLKSSSERSYTPSYIDWTNQENWDDNFKNNYSNKLSQQQISKLGVQYNWAAAVGLDNGREERKFEGFRQGICPNGWHVPNGEEFYKMLGTISEPYTMSCGPEYYGVNKILENASSFNSIVNGDYYSSYGTDEQSAKTMSFSDDIYRDGRAKVNSCFSKKSKCFIRCIKD